MSTLTIAFPDLFAPITSIEDLTTLFRCSMCRSPAYISAKLAMDIDETRPLYLFNKVGWQKNIALQQQCQCFHGIVGEGLVVLPY